MLCVCVCDNGRHLYCVNMDLHFILQVFRVNELKLGSRLKELINALNGHYRLMDPLTSIWLLNLKKKEETSGFVILFPPIWPASPKTNNIPLVVVTC